MLKKMFAAIALLSVSSITFAGASDDAQVHFKAIAAGNVEQIMQAYGDNASLQWVGGPLNGAYTGNEKIKETWGKFAKNAPLDVTVGKIEESSNDKGSTVSANVEFKGKNVIKVRYVLVYREGKLVSEVWQIDPKLSM